MIRSLCLALLFGGCASQAPVKAPVAGLAGVEYSVAYVAPDHVLMVVDLYTGVEDALARAAELERLHAYDGAPIIVGVESNGEYEASLTPRTRQQCETLVLSAGADDSYDPMNDPEWFAACERGMVLR